MQDNIHPTFDKILTRKDKENFLSQRSKVFWLTGLSGSGKSTIAQAVEKKLFKEGYFIQILDGDNVRSGICKNLSFSLEDREENIRRIAEVSKLFMNAGVVCLNSFVSPTVKIRQLAKEVIGEEDFVEIYVEADVALCEERDVKGLYKKARAGEIKGFTGIDSPYEIPNEPKHIVHTPTQSIEECAERLFAFIKEELKPVE